MLSINTNLSSLIAQGSMKSSTNKLNQAIERMTTGFKINHAKDNAANYSISTNMTTKIGAYNVAEDNAAMGLDLLSTAEGTLSQIEDKLQRLRALAEQASNGTYGEQSLNAINAEANALVDEIERLYSTAEYNGLRLFETENEFDNISFCATSIDNTSPISTFSLARATDSSGQFIQEIVRLSESEALELGYTVITTVEELKAIAGSGKYILMNDIDLSGIDWTPISSFSGELNGNGYEISNLSVDVVADYAGFFAQATGEIKNLGFSNASVVGLEESDCLFIGVLAGKFEGTISNCYAKGNVSSAVGSSTAFVGGVVGKMSGEVSYSYFEGQLASNSDRASGGGVGGLVSMSIDDIVIDSCFVQNATISGGTTASGGILYQANSSQYTISNCYVADTNVSTTSASGILVYPSVACSTGVIENCYVNNVTGITDYAISSCVSGASQVLEVVNCSAPSGMILANDDTILVNSSDNLDPDNLPYVFNLIKPVDGGSTGDGIEQPVPDVGGGTGGTTTTPLPPSTNGSYVPEIVYLQIGVNSESYSNISFNIKISLDGLEELRNIGLSIAPAAYGLRSGASPISVLTRCDEILNALQEKAVEFGAVQNRLESVLEEISIQRDNLVSSRSTILDADIAEVSSHYIQQQILQQASATLLATANQSPAIALQLI